MSDQTFLLVLDTPSIKKYVFESNTLIDIVGASGLLDEVTVVGVEQKIKELVETAGGKAEVIYLGGGGGQIKLDHVSADSMDRLQRQLARLAREETCGGAELLSTWVPWDSSYKDARSQAYKQLRALKRQRSPSQLPREALERDCDACSHRSAVDAQQKGKKIRLLCAVCQKRFEFGTRNARKALAAQLQTFAEPLIGDLPRSPGDFSDIAGSDRLAIVYADGNSMGKLIQSITNSEAMKLFSNATDQAIRKACFQSLISCGAIEQHGKNRKVRAQILLLGGDDLVVAVRGSRAFDFVVEVTRVYREESRRLLEENPAGEYILSKLPPGKGLSLSFGVAFGKAHTPARLLIDQAEELLSRAKKRGRKDKQSRYWVPEVIDWHDQVSGGSADLSALRRPHKDPEKKRSLHRTEKPWLIDELPMLLDCARELHGMNIGHSRLNALGSCLNKGFHGAQAEARRIITRSGRGRATLMKLLKDRQADGQRLPWRSLENGRYRSPVADFYELYEIILPTLKGE
jgi:hypothetical protein